MDKITLNVEERKLKGRKVKNLRRDGILPANIFGNKVKSLGVQVDSKHFKEVYLKAGETGVVELNLGKEKRPVLIHNVQLDPVSDLPLHIDFLQVDLTKKVTAQVPIELINVSPAEKQGVGTVVQYINEIEVDALPSDLPDKFEIDLSKLSDVNQTVQIKDIAVDKNKVEVKENPEEIIAKVEPPKEEKVEEVTVVPEGEVAEGEAKAPEGEIAEGEGEKKEEASE